MGPRVGYRAESSSRLKDVGERDCCLEALVSFNGEFLSSQREDDSPQTLAEYQRQMEAANDQLALLLKGIRHYEAQEYESAIDTLSLATHAKRCEYEYLVYQMLGRSQWYLAINVGLTRTRSLEAAVSAERATELNDSFSPAFQLLAATNYHIKRYPEALVAAELLVRLVPRCSEAYIIRGDARSALERYQAALRDYETAVELRPTDWNAHYCLGHGYRHVNEYDKSIEQYRITIQMFPGFKYVCLELIGKAYEARGQYSRAAAAFEEVLKDAMDREVQGPWIAELRERIAACRAQMER